METHKIELNAEEKKSEDFERKDYTHYQIKDFKTSNQNNLPSFKMVLSSKSNDSDHIAFNTDMVNKILPFNESKYETLFFESHFKDKMSFTLELHTLQKNTKN